MEYQHIHIEGSFRVCIDLNTEEYVAYVKIDRDSMSLNIGKGATPVAAIADALTP